MPSALVCCVARRASSIVVPATKRSEKRCPKEELSARCRKERFSERAMKAALSTGDLPVESGCRRANNWFYHACKSRGKASTRAASASVFTEIVLAWTGGGGEFRFRGSYGGSSRNSRSAVCLVGKRIPPTPELSC